ncbi:c-type cytochrome [Caldimonas brevitalea]|uniref:Cytochrome C n=1 Tax=Caldimonas brevitalea TaxID=413882 RepID=A0A0G3BPY2_9BURK|nr:c-type cytochrome [Caldimonas brevitalea]AKJ30043.1 cytochrome C [Caldimonas brevitalea]
MRFHSLPSLRAASGYGLRRRLWAASVLAVMAACADGEAEAPGQRYTRVEGGDAQRGQRLLAQYQCGSCHAIPRVPGAVGTMGPSLEAFGRRSYIAGHVPNVPGPLQQWLQNPQALVPGTPMPALGVSADDARDMAAYLMSQP